MPPPLTTTATAVKIGFDESVFGVVSVNEAGDGFDFAGPNIDSLKDTVRHYAEILARQAKDDNALKGIKPPMILALMLENMQGRAWAVEADPEEEVEGEEEDPDELGETDDEDADEPVEVGDEVTGNSDGAPVGYTLAADGTLVRNVFCATGPGGGVDPTCSTSIPKGVDVVHEEFKSLAKTDKAEHQAIFDAVTGKLVHRDRGTAFGESTEHGGAASATVPLKLLTGDDKFNQVHTHPGGGGPSDADWGMMGWGNIQTMTMVAPEATFVIEHVGGTKRHPSPRELRDYYGEQLTDLESKTDMGDDSIDAYVQKILHEVNLRMAKKYRDHFKYTRRPH